MTVSGNFDKKCGALSLILPKLCDFFVTNVLQYLLFNTHFCFTAAPIRVTTRVISKHIFVISIALLTFI